MRIPSDFHLHSEHSEDSTAPMKSMIERGIALELPSMCFTDHMDLDYPQCPDLPAGSFHLDADSYRKDFEKNKKTYSDKIDLHFGVELGLQPHITKENHVFLSENSFEFIIGSTHLIRHQDPYYGEFWKDRDEKDVFAEYFRESLENVRLFDDFDVYGHLDYVVRYAPNKDKYYDPSEYTQITDELMKILISRDQGLDLNSKALYSGMADPNPCSYFLNRFRELGGRIITFGSDAHKPEDLAREFIPMREIAIFCGFTEYCTYENRNPVFHKL